MQWAPPKARAVPETFGRLVRLRPAEAWLLVLLCIDSAAAVDLFTGPDLWLGPVYLLVMCVAAWTLGWAAGQLIGVACMGLTFSLNGLKLYPHGDAEFAWNIGMRFVAISLVIAAIAGMRRAYVKEWWLARTDNLTGALNRQAFFELAPQTIAVQRWRLLIYADLDGLKKVNDIRGHAAGDACLRAYGAAVRKMIRQYDMFARVGGDEFLIFMGVKDEASAKSVAARLHQAMNSISAESRNLHCSVGGLIVPPGDASIDDLVRGADNLMYQAKLRGAALQLGVASHVQGLEGGRARPPSRTPITRGRAGKHSVIDRRAHSESFTPEPTPR